MLTRALILTIAIVLPAAAQATRCPADLPVLLVVQDKSGTMAEVPDPACPSCPTKWQSAKDAMGRLSQKFANRFRFAVELFPHDSTTFNCTTGTTVTTFPASSSDITAAYSAVAPGGGTPTATSLDAASGYLKSLKLTEPAYVLLLTDGLPNCNLALDPATCAPSQPACGDVNGHGSPNCGAKGCLDDQGANAAAGRVFGAGYKTYVLGFDASASANNNKAVLDGIASAGHTTAAYTASDTVSLDAALDAIAYNAATCCKDICTLGAAQCTADGKLSQCQVDDAGCTNWITAACPTKGYCEAGACKTCQDQCTEGDKRCTSSDVEICQKGQGGCTAWVKSQTCGASQVCQAGSCQSCDKCVAGDHRCGATDGVDTCSLFESGCYDWSTSACKPGFVCSAGACQSCTTTCTKGEKRCQGKAAQECVADANGCTSWSAGTTCVDFCSGGVCGACGTSCVLNSAQCNGNSVEKCQADANGCTVWTSVGPCAANEFCGQGACQTCPTLCAASAKSCNGLGIEECQQQANGCDEWIATGSCKAGDTCQDGRCTTPCQDACTLGALSCDAQSHEPMSCEKGIDGCAAWRPAALCGAKAMCLQGICRDRCTGGEIETCPDGYLCTGLPEGDFCLPGTAPDAGVTPPQAGLDAGVSTGKPDAGGLTTDPGADPKTGASGKSPGGGCGCNALPAPLGLLALVPLLGLLRRRRAP
jgi:hypothetical protein